MQTNERPLCEGETPEAIENDGGMSESETEQNTPWRIPETLRDYYFDWGDKVDLGAYPQPIRNREIAVNAEPDKDGCYAGSDGVYIKRGGAFFHVEPLQWKILKTEDDTALVISQTAIACSRFDLSSNNYANSEIRSFLNGEFYDSAFGTETKKRIIKTLVDNSAASAGNADGRTICGNTYDRVFLLSLSEIKDHGDIVKEIWTSDFADEGQDFIWLRSPATESGRAFGVAPAQDCAPRSVFEKGGVVPAMRISLR